MFVNSISIARYMRDNEASRIRKAENAAGDRILRNVRPAESEEGPADIFTRARAIFSRVRSENISNGTGIF